MNYYQNKNIRNGKKKMKRRVKEIGANIEYYNSLFEYKFKILRKKPNYI